ncbi:gastric intrinsic factor [Biomphalaria glabrata]|nr:gastric intrinsic factor [Biomphalaria glabrata]
MCGKSCLIILCMFIATEFVAHAQLSSKKRKNQCEFEQPDCGFCGKRINVTLIARNTIREPLFEVTADVTRVHKRELLSFLEIAAQTASEFKFVVSNAGSGYQVESINGLPRSNEEQWQILSNDIPLECGVSNYIPRSDDTIVFNFTSTLQ